MRTLTRQLSSWSLAAASLLLAAGAAAQTADAFPNKTIRIIVPTVPGGQADVTARRIGQKMAEKLGQPVIVDNRPGADTLLGTRAVKDAPADGYTLLLQASGLSVFPHIKKEPGYELKDFAAVGPIVRSPLVVLVGADSRDKSVQDFVARAKANPARTSYAHGGVGTPPHIGAAMFLQRAGLNIAEIPYKGNAAAIPDVLSGRVDMIFDAYSTAVGQIKAGKARALGISSASRLASLPEVPTIAEQGYPNFSYYFWLGLLAPAQTPKPVLDKLAAALRASVADLAEQFRSEGNEAMTMAPEEFNEYLRRETAQMGKLVSDLKLEKQ